MASDIFIKIAGIPGESFVSGHENEIDVLSWSWGVSNIGTAHGGGGMGAGKASFTDITITKQVDKSSPALYKVCADGKHITEATLVCRKAGEKPLEYITIVMQEILVTGIHTADSFGQGNGSGNETVTLNFGKVKYKYVQQTAEGSAGDIVDFNWNIRANTAI